MTARPTRCMIAVMRTKTIRDESIGTSHGDDFRKIADNLKPDAKRRVLIPESVVADLYDVYTNNAGQILLDPRVTIPASEAWLYEDREALDSVRRGFSDAAQGRATKIDPNDL